MLARHDSIASMTGFVMMANEGPFWLAGASALARGTGAGDAAHGGAVGEGIPAAHVPFAEHAASGLPRGEQTGDGCAGAVQDASVGVDAETRRGEADGGGSTRLISYVAQ